MKKIGLYIHIPFCEKKCDYCNFVSFCKPIEIKLQYIDCLIKEISMQSVKFEDYEVDTIFIGGGTPSCLPAGAINKIMNAVYRNFKVLTSAEITI
ncbi:MAG TPA: coproporphyrinogen III oxidase, partial [Clostridiales bacterium]|nr:coproporphyrinogen III oxidase [Clostridiales bacterium]